MSLFFYKFKILALSSVSKSRTRANFTLTFQTDVAEVPLKLTGRVLELRPQGKKDKSLQSAYSTDERKGLGCGAR